MLISPAPLVFDADGSAYSPRYEDIYHPVAGGFGQARHVFLGGNALPQRWRGRNLFVIVELGFGTGLNFLATWAAWRADAQRPQRLHFVSVDKHPFSARDLEILHAPWTECGALAAELRRDWPPLVPGYHRLEFDGGRVILTLLFGEATICMARLRAGADAFFLDGFAPAKNPQMWSPQLFKLLGRLANPSATLATWSVAAGVGEALAGAGFATEKQPGFGHKREMLRGWYAPNSRTRARHRPGSTEPRRAVVIGAGLAGTAACERLAARGWEIELIERFAEPARGASGNLAGVLRPMLARDDNIAARLSRASYLYAISIVRRLAQEGLPLRWSNCGVLQIARDAAHEDAQQSMVAALRLPPDFASFLAREEASLRAGRMLAAGGWLFPAGGWISPPTLCRALLARHADGIGARYSRRAGALERTGDVWLVRAADGRILAQAPVVVLANAIDALAFAQARTLPLKRVRGQVTHLPAALLGPLPVLLCREGYVTPPIDGMNCVGASFDFDDDDPNPNRNGHAGNLSRLERLLPGAAAAIDVDTLEGWVGFRTASRDRLPLIGALPMVDAAVDLRQAQLADVPRLPGLYSLLGYGARGLAWSQLAAELLASKLEGEPLPLEADLVDAVDPGRFLLRSQRRRAGAARAVGDAG